MPVDLATAAPGIGVRSRDTMPDNPDVTCICIQEAAPSGCICLYDLLFFKCSGVVSSALWPPDGLERAVKHSSNATAQETEQHITNSAMKHL